MCGLKPIGVKVLSKSFTYHCADEEAMQALGQRISKITPDTAVLFLYGNLGAGKTTFSRGFLRGKGFLGIVKSPTYTLVEPYTFSDGTIYHFDFYRLNEPDELHAMGIADYFANKAVCLIEWPEKGEGSLPSPDLSFYIEPEGAGRKVRMVAYSSVGMDILERFHHEN